MSYSRSLQRIFVLPNRNEETSASVASGLPYSRGQIVLVIDTLACDGVTSVVLRTSASPGQVRPSAAEPGEQKLIAGHAGDRCEPGPL